jgi:hypothetical protein
LPHTSLSYWRRTLNRLKESDLELKWVKRGPRKHLRLKESMASVADFKEEYQPQSWERLKASIRTRISVWIGLAAFVGWVLSRIARKKRRTYVPGSKCPQLGAALAYFKVFSLAPLVLVLLAVFGPFQAYELGPEVAGGTASSNECEKRGIWKLGKEPASPRRSRTTRSGLGTHSKGLRERSFTTSIAWKQ